MAKNISKKIYIKVPTESSNYSIDDFLGNCFQYKIGEEWIYDTQTYLPTSNLQIVGVVDKDECVEMNLDPNHKWISIREI